MSATLIPLDTGLFYANIADSEFGIQGFLENNFFLPTKQAGTNICKMMYRDIILGYVSALVGRKTY